MRLAVCFAGSLRRVVLSGKPERDVPEWLLAYPLSLEPPVPAEMVAARFEEGVLRGGPEPAPRKLGADTFVHEDLELK